jgi:hypothetical protein
MSILERAFPGLLTELHQLTFDYAAGQGYDFEPYRKFLSEAETRDWIRAWTGNDELDGAEFFVFGQDGTGGYAAFWLARLGAPLLHQPVVFLGSEGTSGVVAPNLADYLWLLAGGVGPCEAIEQPRHPPAAAHLSAAFRDFAQKHASSGHRMPAEIVEAAQREFPDFPTHIEAICR